METQIIKGSTVQHLRILHNNPFIFSTPLTTFYSALGIKEKSILLSYLVLPLLTYEPSRAFLIKGNKTSSIRTMLKDKSRLYGLEERVQQQKKLTNSTVRYLLDNDITTLSECLAVLVNNNADHLPSPEGMNKAANRLGIILSPYDVPTVYRLLGVMSL